LQEFFLAGFYLIHLLIFRDLFLSVLSSSITNV